MTESQKQVPLLPQFHRFDPYVRIAPIQSEAGSALEVQAPLGVATAVLALKRFRGLAAMARTTAVAILPYWGAGVGARQPADTGGSAWLVPPAALGQRISGTAAPTGEAGTVVPEDLAVIYVPASQAAEALRSAFPGAVGLFVFVPHAWAEIHKNGEFALQDASWARHELPNGGMSTAGLDNNGNLTIRSPSRSGEAAARPLNVSSTLPSAPQAQESEQARAASVDYYKRVNVGRGRRRMSVWKRFHYDELVVTNRRLIFANGGVRQLQLSLDPALAARAVQAASGITGTFQLSDDVAGRVPIVVEFSPRTYIFRPIPFPGRLRFPLWGITFILSLALIGLWTYTPVLVAVAMYVLLFQGIPTPWPGVRVVATTGSLGRSVLRHMAYGVSTKLFIPDEQQRRRVVECVGNQVREVVDELGR